MRKLGRMIRRRSLTASVFLAAFLAVTAIDAVLPTRDRQALAAWASTSVANLEHHPVASERGTMEGRDGESVPADALLVLLCGRRLSPTRSLPGRGPGCVVTSRCPPGTAFSWIADRPGRGCSC